MVLAFSGLACIDMVFEHIPLFHHCMHTFSAMLSCREFHQLVSWEPCICGSWELLEPEYDMDSISISCPSSAELG